MTRCDLVWSWTPAALLAFILFMAPEGEALLWLGRTLGWALAAVVCVVILLSVGRFP